MKMTSKDANKMLGQLLRDLSYEKAKEIQSSTFIAATIENKEDVRPEYNYGETQKRISEINAKILELKHALNRFNVNTVVPEFGMTIDEMLIYIPQLTERKNKLERMKSRLKFERVMDRSKPNIIEYTYVNYDLKKAEEDYRLAEDELARAQIALDRVNITAEFEVEI